MQKTIIFAVALVFVFLANIQPVSAFTYSYNSLIPDDVYFFRQTYLDAVKIPQAWKTVQQNQQQRNVVIALLDTGVDIDHPDLITRVWTNIDEIPGDGIDNDNNSFIDDVHGWDFVSSNSDPRPKHTEDYDREAVHHGTIVAGIVAAEFNSKEGIAGAAYNARIMPLRVLDSLGAGNTLLLSQAIDYAVENGADIINLSLVGTEEDPRLTESIKKAYNAGVAIVAASGNTEEGGVNLNESPRYPVCDSDSVNRVIGVAAVDEKNLLASFSNYGSECIDISAPGVNFFSTVWFRDGDEEFSNYYQAGWSGTSVAAPLVSSALGLIKQVAPNLSISESYQLLLSNTDSLRQHNSKFADLGSGIMNVEKAVNAAMSLSRDNPIRMILSSGPGSTPKLVIVDDQGVAINQFYAYSTLFKGGFNSATGDVDGDGDLEIITAPMAGGGPHIRIFNMQGEVESQFMAYESNFGGGVNVSVGDINYDGKDEIITAPMSNYQPLVKAFDYQGKLLTEFNAYSTNFRGGVEIQVGNLDGLTGEEIVTAPASGGGPHIRFFNAFGQLKGQFMAFDPSFNGGYSLGIGNFNNTPGNELVVTQLIKTNPQIKMFDNYAKLITEFPVYPSLSYSQQVTELLVGDYTGNGIDEILAQPKIDGAQYFIYDYEGKLIKELDLAQADPKRKLDKYSTIFLKQ